MPTFDLRGIKVAQYNNVNGTITYGTPMSAGGAMTVNLEIRYAEGRLYAESKLAEYMKSATGGTISLATKYIPEETKALLFGATTTTASESTPATVTYGAKDNGKYVGVGFYAPAMVDGVQKFACAFIAKCLFGAPAMNYQTKGENIQFETPTTTGEFLPDDSASETMIVTATTDTEAAAIAWVASRFAG